MFFTFYRIHILYFVIPVLEFANSKQELDEVRPLCNLWKNSSFVCKFTMHRLYKNFLKNKHDLHKKIPVLGYL